MKITAQEEYGLRCLVAVARAQRGDRPVAMSAIAKAEGLSTQYVAKLMNVLKRHGLVVSVRGLSGGFKLARATTQIAVIEVLQALGSGFEFGSAQLCSHFPGKHTACVHLGGCSVRPMWMMIQRHITEFLQHLTMQDLLDEEAAASQRMEQYMRDASRVQRDSWHVTRDTNASRSTSHESRVTSHESRVTSHESRDKEHRDDHTLLPR